MTWLMVAALCGMAFAAPLGAFGEGAQPDNPAVSPVIRSVTVNGQPVVPRRGMVNLSSGQQRIAFSFVPAPGGTNTTARMRYRLDGFDTAWGRLTMK